MGSIAICEDDPIFREQLTVLLKTYLEWRMKEWGEEVQICNYANGKDYKNSWSLEGEADILLLDIEMEKMDGICLKEFLEKEKSKTKIIFITNHMEVMQEAFGANVYGFLVKPLKEEKLFFYLNKIYRDIRHEEMEVFIDNAGRKRVKLYQIFWIKADGRYSEVKRENDSIFSDQSLTEWEKSLDKFFFFRVHKSYLVNFQQVLKITDEVVFVNGDRVPVARRKKRDLKEAYKKFLIQSAI